MKRRGEASVVSTNELDKRFDLLLSPRRLRWVGKAKNDSLPLDFGLLGIDEKAQGAAGGSQIVETLGCVFIGQTFGTFQLHHQRVLDRRSAKYSPTECPL